MVLPLVPEVSWAWHEMPAWMRGTVVCSHVLSALFHILDDSVAPDKISGSKQVQAIVCEIFTEFAVLVNKERVEVNPSHTLSLAHFFHGTVAIDYHLFAVF